MKRVFKLLLCVFGALLIFSCGSRKVETAKAKEETEKVEAVSEVVKIDSSATIKINQNVEISEKLEDFEIIITKEYFESGALKSEKKERRKGTKMSDKRYQDEKVQTSEIQLKKEKEEKIVEAKALTKKEKAMEREESLLGFWLPMAGFLSLIFFLWLRFGKK